MRILSLKITLKMTSEQFPQKESNEQGPTEEERERLEGLIRELEAFAKRPWFKTFIDGVVLGPSRLMERGVSAIFRKLKKEEDRHD